MGDTINKGKAVEEGRLWKMVTVPCLGKGSSRRNFTDSSQIEKQGTSEVEYLPARLVS